MCNCVKHTETSKTDTKPEVKVVTQVAMHY